MGRIVNIVLLFLMGTILEPIATGLKHMINNGVSIDTTEELAEATVKVAEQYYPPGHEVFETLPTLIHSIANTSHALVGKPKPK